MFRTQFASIIRSIINCSSGVYTPPLIPAQDLFHPEPMTNTSGCYYSL